MTTRKFVPLYAEYVNMIEGLDDEEVNQYFLENPKIIPLFEIDVIEIITPFMSNDEKDVGVPVDEKTLMELWQQQEAMEKEMQVSQRVHASTLEELNLVENNVNSQGNAISREDQAHRITTTIQRCVCMVVQGYEGIGSYFLSTSDQPT